jgi:hypothetical protein
LPILIARSRLDRAGDIRDRLAYAPPDSEEREASSVRPFGTGIWKN